MIRILVALSLVALVGCEAMPIKEDRHKYALAAFAAASAADVVTTSQGLDRGCVENNPLFGENPDEGALIAGKLVGYAVAHYVVAKTETSWWLWPITALTAGVAVNNHGACR